MIQDLLKTLKTPGQYINSEWNSETKNILSKKTKKNLVKICLCFPDKYTIGMSNLGIEILYKLLNSYEDIICERVFACDIDFENLLRKQNIILYSLETQQKLSDFDIIGFSLQSELNYTNIFTILDLAKINFKSKDRKKIFPLIIAGGPCSSNPSVLKNYIDFFILGEAEESFLKVVQIVKKYKNKLKIENVNEEFLKKELLKEINQLEETYVPLFEEKEVIPAKINIKRSFYPQNPTVPIIRTTHLRANIEVTRGCGYNCNFCQSGYISKPLRFRDKEYVIEIIKNTLDNTGYEEIALTGFCVTNYPYIKEVLDFINLNYKDKYISVSLPSLRIEDIDEELLLKIPKIRKPTITLAPEAATDYLRKVINKEISNQQIFEKIILLYKNGFTKVKLYFIIGLPKETFEDIQAIVKFIKEIKKYFRLNLKITISCLVPKPHTPFQYTKMDNFENLYQKLLFIKKNLGELLHIKYSSLKAHIYSSIIEALICRGDQTIGNLIEEVWKEGARFDSWQDYFNWEIWLKKINQLNIDLSKYIYTETTPDTKFPWDNIKYSLSKQTLYEKYINSLSIEKPTNFTTKQYDFSKEISTYNFTNLNNKSKQGVYTARLRFSRKGKIKFISYLDQLEIIKRALRMSKLPINYSCGYNPQIKMSLSLAIPVGYESNSEYVDVELTEPIYEKEIEKKLNCYLPDGFSLIDVKIFNLPLNKLPSLNSTVNLIEYIVESKNITFEESKLQKFLNSSFWEIEKQNSNIKINLIELVKKIKILQYNKIQMFIRFFPNKNLKPEIVISEIFNIPNTQLYELDIIRENLYIETNSGNILSLI